MILKSIQFNNFMPFKGDTNKIIFSSDGRKKVTLIDGQNTRGKTAINRAIRWCLYGNIEDKGNQISYLNILNWTASSENDFICNVDLYFDHQGNQYRLKRDFRYEGQGKPAIDSDFEENVHFFKDDVVQSKAQQEEAINQILPEAIANFSLFDGELLDEYEKLLKAGDEGANLKNDIEKVLGVPALINGKNDLEILKKDAAKQVQKEASSSNTDQATIKQIEILQKHRNVCEETIEKLKKQQDETQGKLADIEKNEGELESQHKKITEYEIEKNDLKKQRTDYEDLEKKLKEATRYSWKFLLQPKILDREKEVSQEDSEENFYKKLGRLELEQEILQKSIKNTECYFCLNTSFKIDIFKNKLDEKKQEIIEYQDSYEKSDFIKSKSLKKILDDVGDGKLTKISEERKKCRVNLQEQVTKVENLLKGNLPEKEFKKIKDIYEKKGKLKSFEEDLMNKIKEENLKMADFDKQIDILNGKLNKNNSNSNPKTGMNARQKYDIYDQIGEAFKRSTMELRDELKQEVEKVASKTFIKMINRDNYKTLKINDGYGLTIIADDDSPINIRSAGASQVVALSLISALSQVGIEKRLILMDTPFGRLDKAHRRNILETLPEITNQLILLHHDGEITDDDLTTIKDRIGVQYQVLITNDSKNSYIQKV